MALRLVQAGEGDSRPLVLAFLVAGTLDRYLQTAFGPRPCIVADGLAQGPMLPEMLDFALRHAKLRQASQLALIGYSAGCQRVRALRLAGVNASAYLLMDGTHASWPPEEWQISWLRDLAEQAKAGRILVIATHTLQTYMEELPKGKAFASTWRVLRMATGWPLDRPGPIEQPGITREGALCVYSYASAKADAKAHAAQHGLVPALCAAHLGPWLDEHAADGVAQRQGTSGALGIGLVGMAAMVLLRSTSRT